MTSISQKIIELAIDEINLDQDPDNLISKKDEQLLLNESSSIDSLTLVRLLITIERLAEEEIGEAVVIVDESTFDSTVSPFGTVGSLKNHIKNILKS
ncbi:hypothetical protein [Polynucleobacter hallstattensis]|uniref:hypothetical protein n=1 Tax=Polynucleobacter hallstattensis TaxID=1855586 RepID=UPI001C0E8966|nr:hypothetical protein [Polynucleobacter hallstattensis]MBU3560596.1 hypothetical protein [Polynucleobacter hallstattensis]